MHRLRRLALLPVVAVVLTVASAANPALASLHALDHIERGADAGEEHEQDERNCEVCQSLLQVRWALTPMASVLATEPTLLDRITPVDPSAFLSRLSFSPATPRAPPHS